MSTFIVFQHANGVGHFTRCSALAAAFLAIGPVTLFSGGPPIAGCVPPPGVAFVQLPATRWNYAPGAQVTPVDPWLDAPTADCQRGAMLVEQLLRQRPRVVVVEYYPFAPGRFDQTLNPLFETIEALPVKPLVVCSIRSHPRLGHLDAHVDPRWINQQLKQHFAAVLHHVDASMFPLTSLEPYLQVALADVPVVQTGFVRRALRKAHEGPGSGLLLTVGGGSAAGAALIGRWVEAARIGALEAGPLSVVCGPLMSEHDRARVHRLRGDGVVVHDRVPTLTT